MRPSSSSMPEVSAVSCLVRTWGVPLMVGTPVAELLGGPSCPVISIWWDSPLVVPHAVVYQWRLLAMDQPVAPPESSFVEPVVFKEMASVFPFARSMTAK